jgi:hypothetical protein
MQQVKSFLTSFFLACGSDELQRLSGKIKVWDAWAIAQGYKFLVSTVLPKVLDKKLADESFEDFADRVACDPALWNT